MLKQSITFQNLDDEEVTEDFYFQITKAEVAEKALIEGEGYYERLRDLSAETDGAKIIGHFKVILASAVGRREGQIFKKSQEITDYFMFSGAYDAFFMGLMEKPDSGASIIRAMLPKDAREEATRLMKERGLEVVELPGSGTVEKVAEPEKPMVSQETVDQAKAISDHRDAQSQSSDNDEPIWLKETRYPTKQELMKMGSEETRLAMKMKSQKAFG